MIKGDILLELKNYLRKNKGKHQIIRIGIFGSAARGEMMDNSDIDIVVQLRQQDLFHLIGIKQDLEESFNLPVDIVSYRDNMNASLKKRIDREAVYV